MYLVPFASYLTLNNIVTLKSGLQVTQVIETFAIQKFGCGFLFAFHSNYSAILYRLREAAYSQRAHKRLVNVFVTFTIVFRIGSECPFIERIVLVKNVFSTTSKRYVNVYR